MNRAGKGDALRTLLRAEIWNFDAEIAEMARAFCRYFRIPTASQRRVSSEELQTSFLAIPNLPPLAKPWNSDFGPCASRALNPSK
jgi:hypothetical protein